MYIVQLEIIYYNKFTKKKKIFLIGSKNCRMLLIYFLYSYLQNRTVLLCATAQKTAFLEKLINKVNAKRP